MKLKIMKQTLFFSVLLSFSSFAQEVRTVAQDNSFFKYDIANPTKPGLCRELVDAISVTDPSLKFTGLNKAIPLARIEDFLQYSKIDVFFCMLKSEERMKKFNFIDIPLYNISHVIVTKSNDEILTKPDLTLEDISKVGTILVNKGSALVTDLSKQGIKFQAGAKDDLQILDMLEKKRGRFYYAQDMTARYVLQKSNLAAKYSLYPKVFKTEQQYIAYSKNLSPIVLNKITSAIQKLQKQGKLKAIYQKYTFSNLAYNQNFLVQIE